MKKLFAVVMAIVTMFVFVGCGGASGKDGKSAMSPEQAEKNSIKIIQTALECNDETAKKHYDVLKSVGLTPVEEIFYTKAFLDSALANNNVESLDSQYIVKGAGEYVLMVVVETKSSQIIRSLSRINGGYCYNVGNLITMNPDDNAIIGMANPTGKITDTVELIINHEQADKVISIAHSSVREALKGRVIKFKLCPNGMNNGYYRVRKSKLEKDAKAPFIVSGYCYMIDETGCFKRGNYIVNLDNNYKVKHIVAYQFLEKGRKQLVNVDYN